MSVSHSVSRSISHPASQRECSPLSSLREIAGWWRRRGAQARIDAGKFFGRSEKPANEIKGKNPSVVSHIVSPFSPCCLPSIHLRTPTHPYIHIYISPLLLRISVHIYTAAYLPTYLSIYLPIYLPTYLQPRPIISRQHRGLHPEPGAGRGPAGAGGEPGEVFRGCAQARILHHHRCRRRRRRGRGRRRRRRRQRGDTLEAGARRWRGKGPVYRITGSSSRPVAPVRRRDTLSAHLSAAADPRTTHVQPGACHPRAPRAYSIISAPCSIVRLLARLFVHSRNQRIAT